MSFITQFLPCLPNVISTSRKEQRSAPPLIEQTRQFPIFTFVISSFNEKKEATTMITHEMTKSTRCSMNCFRLIVCLNTE